MISDRKSSGASEPTDHLLPPREQQAVELLVQQVGWVGHDGGGLSVQSGETEPGHPCELRACVRQSL